LSENAPARGVNPDRYICRYHPRRSDQRARRCGVLENKAEESSLAGTGGTRVRTHRFGQKLKLPSTMAIKHQIRRLMAEDALKKAELEHKAKNLEHGPEHTKRV
jgi:hypothetical protein